MLLKLNDCQILTKFISVPSDSNPCAKRICECDLRYAQRLAEHESKWDVQFHTERNNGSWKYNEQFWFLLGYLSSKLTSSSRLFKE